MQSTKLPQTQPIPRALLDNIRLFSNLKTGNSYLINKLISLLMTDSFVFMQLKSTSRIK